MEPRKTITSSAIVGSKSRLERVCQFAVPGVLLFALAFFGAWAYACNESVFRTDELPQPLLHKPVLISWTVLVVFVSAFAARYAKWFWIPSFIQAPWRIVKNTFTLMGGMIVGACVNVVFDYVIIVLRFIHL